MQREPAPWHEALQGRLSPLRGVLGLVERELSARPALDGFVIFHGGCDR